MKNKTALIVLSLTMLAQPLSAAAETVPTEITDAADAKKAAESEEATSLLNEILEPRIFGYPDAKSRLLIIQAPAWEKSNQFMLSNFPILLKLAADHKIVMEIRTFANHQLNIPVDLTARCINPDYYVTFLLFAAQNAIALSKNPASTPEKVRNIVLSSPGLWLKGYTKEQMTERLLKCEALRRDFVFAQEKQRWDVIYKYNIPLPARAPVVVLNDGQMVINWFEPRGPEFIQLLQRIK